MDVEIEKLKKAGEIARKVKEFSREIIKKEMNLLEIAEKIETKITELGGKVAFPVNLSINEIAAHSTPSWNDSTKAHGLLKIDLGVHIDGNVADTAFSIDLENNERNRILIEAAELGLNRAIEKIKVGSELREVGAEIERAIKSKGMQPIQNLSGHSISTMDLHSGITIPNYDNSSTFKIREGVYAIEPFATNGFGSVRDGRQSGIYKIEKNGNVRDSFAREVLRVILQEYGTLPFCSRWIYKKFGSRGLLAIRRIEEAGLLHQYAQLIERGNGIVAQAEHTILLFGKDKLIIT